MGIETELSIVRGIAGAQGILRGQEAADINGKEHNFPFHTLNFWGDVNRSNSPYAFSLNIERYRELLSEIFGLSPQEMKRIDIHVVGEGLLRLPRLLRENILPGGKKRVIGREITTGLTGINEDESVPPSPWERRPINASIYLFTFWHFFVTERRMILKYVKKQTEKIKQKLIDKHMRVFFVTDEMLTFLASSPELADERLRKLAGIKLREEILEITAHEAASHFFDTTRGTVDEDQEMRKRLKAKLFGLEYTPPTIMEQFRNHPVVQRLLPNPPRPSRPKKLLFEDLAKAAETLAGDSRWRDLIEFEINPNWPFQNDKSKPVNDHEVGDVAGQSSGLDSAT